MSRDWFKNLPQEKQHMISQKLYQKTKQELVKNELTASRFKFSTNIFATTNKNFKNSKANTKRQEQRYKKSHNWKQDKEFISKLKREQN